MLPRVLSGAAQKQPYGGGDVVWWRQWAWHLPEDRPEDKPDLSDSLTAPIPATARVGYNAGNHASTALSVCNRTGVTRTVPSPGCSPAAKGRIPGSLGAYGILSGPSGYIPSFDSRFQTLSDVTSTRAPSMKIYPLSCKSSDIRDLAAQKRHPTPFVLWLHTYILAYCKLK